MTHTGIDCGVQVAPRTVAHITKLAALGGYNTVGFFRVDRGFVAQVAGVDEWSRKVPLNPQQKVGMVPLLTQMCS